MKKVTKSASKPSLTGVEITSDNFAGYLFYVGRRVRTSSIRKESIGKVSGKLRTGFYVLLEGTSGMLAHPCRFDGNDIFAVGKEEDRKFCSLSAINMQDPETIKAEIVTASELVSRAKKSGKAYEVKRRSDDTEFRVVTLNPVTDSYTVGIRPNAKQTGISVVNMEPVAGHNKKEVQYTNHRDIPAAPILRELAKVTAA